MHYVLLNVIKSENVSKQGPGLKSGIVTAKTRSLSQKIVVQSLDQAMMGLQHLLHIYPKVSHWLLALLGQERDCLVADTLWSINSQSYSGKSSQSCRSRCRAKKIGLLLNKTLQWKWGTSPIHQLSASKVQHVRNDWACRQHLRWHRCWTMINLFGVKLT